MLRNRRPAHAARAARHPPGPEPQRRVPGSGTARTAWRTGRPQGRAPTLAGQRTAPTGGSNPALLAHGISVALYNTAFGLIIAIPALMFYRYFRGLVDEHVLELEQATERMVPHLMRFAVRVA